MGVFENHKGVDVFYFTSDGQAFYTEKQAANHQNALGEKGHTGCVTKVTREEYDQLDSEPEASVVAPASNMPAPLQLTTVERRALSRQRGKVAKLLEALTSADDTQDENNELRNTYNKALEVLKGMRGYQAMV